ncbi:carbohydrate ABC transporter permease [Microlunatus flavus]|uniref:Raffinose/stachyose/melibiose transport system permease protein n=1 Tax=Microlunatus flavus TaxID=1036181 RepID=A0A1H9A975_9ACTN|nr:carbohydrate ABC transporter permease [Microlunatus flavus]SEP72993.1 raffinose/stachyose/melibiose transport system permease protein [Microlunatus flavus]
MRRYSSRTFLLEIVMVAAALVFVFPLWMLISVGFRSSADVARNPLGAPTSLYLDNFVEGWRSGALGPAMVNSVIIVVSAVVILVVVGAAASYYFARSSGRTGGRLYLVVAAGLMVPFQIGVLPLYRLFTQVGLAGNPLSVILFNAGIQLPLTVLLYTGFMRQLPVEYEEAARVDGATSWQVFRRVIVPLLLPVTGTVVILDGIAIWNEFFTPLLYLGGTGNVTLPVQIYNFAGEYGADWGRIFAGLLLASIPVLIVFFVFQRYIIRSFGSGLKG